MSNNMRRQKTSMMMTEAELAEWKIKTRKYNVLYHQKRLMFQTEEERNKRLELQRMYHKTLTQAQRKHRRILGLENYRKRMQQETESEKRARQDRENESRRKRRARLTPEEDLARRKRLHDKYLRSKLNETPEQREKRLERQKNYNRIYKQRFTPEEFKVHVNKYREHYKKIRRELMKEETPEQREKRLSGYKRNREKCYQKMKMTMTEADREARLARIRKRNLIKRMEETEAEREIRLARVRQYNLKGHARRRLLREMESNPRNKVIKKPCPKKKSVGIESNVQTNSTINVTVSERPKRSTKLNARNKIRELMDIDSSWSDGSEEANDFLEPPQRETRNDFKLRLRPVVLLERICVNDYQNLTPIVSTSSSEDTKSVEIKVNRSETEKWSLRNLEVRLERIDVAKAIEELKSKVMSSSVSSNRKMGLDQSERSNGNGSSITRWFPIIHS